MQLLRADSNGAAAASLPLLPGRHVLQWVESALSGYEPSQGTFSLGLHLGTAQLQTAAAVAAKYELNQGTNARLDFTASNAGSWGNALRVTATIPAVENSPLSIARVGPVQYHVSLATNAGDAAKVETAFAGDDNDVTFTARTAGAAGNDLSVSWADDAEALDVAFDAATGILLISYDGANPPTAGDVIAAVNDLDCPITAGNKGEDDGSGDIPGTAPADMALTGGGANRSATTTGVQLKAAFDAQVDNIVVTIPSGTGASVLAAFVAQLAGGADITYTPEALIVPVTLGFGEDAFDVEWTLGTDTHGTVEFSVATKCELQLLVAGANSGGALHYACHRIH